MKLLRFKRQTSPKDGYKSLTMSQKTEDKESKTIVRKNFVYEVSRSEEADPVAEAPEIFIKKSFDTAKQVEKFNFQVKGYFYMTHKRMMLKVKFHHTLNIKITWKTKNFSPKKSEVLT